jgi:hypothetical protein
VKSLLYNIKIYEQAKMVDMCPRLASYMSFDNKGVGFVRNTSRYLRVKLLKYSKNKDVEYFARWRTDPVVTAMMKLKDQFTKNNY